MSASYDYHRPRSLEEAWRLHAEIPGARFIAGGTDLQVQLMKERIETPPALIALRSIPELGGIAVADGFRIGSRVTIGELIDHPAVGKELPALHLAARSLGSAQVRNVATIGGNLCNASPAAELAPPLLVAGARLEIRGPRESRAVTLEELFRGPGRTCLCPGEILAAVVIPRPSPGSRATYLRQGRVRIDLATASVAALLEWDGSACRNVRLAAGAVAPVPLRLREAEEILEGRAPDDNLLGLAAAAASAAISPITDLHSSAHYRRHLVGVFTRRAIARLTAAGNGTGGER
ncbi:MAG: FAD binding domain-containing protein [Planctomycetota bacterium]